METKFKQLFGPGFYDEPEDRKTDSPLSVRTVESIPIDGMSLDELDEKKMVDESGPKTANKHLLKIPTK